MTSASAVMMTLRKFRTMSLCSSGVLDSLQLDLLFTHSGQGLDLLPAWTWAQLSGQTQGF